MGIIMPNVGRDDNSKEEMIKILLIRKVIG